MGRPKGSLVPIRGSVEDWGPGKHQRNLERKDAYARKMREQATKGPPDFEKLLAEGVLRPEEKRALATRAKKKKAKASSRTAKPAKAVKKKKSLARKRGKRR